MIKSSNLFFDHIDLILRVFMSHFYMQKKCTLRYIYLYTLYIGAMDRRKSDVPTEIFSQGLENPLARELEKPL